MMMSENNKQRIAPETGHPTGFIPAGGEDGFHKPPRGKARTSALKSWMMNAITSLKIITPVLILIAAFAGYGMLKASKPTPPKPKRVEKVWPVQTKIAAPEAIIPKIRLYGKTVSRRQVELRALVAGQITKTGPGLKEGAAVKQGDVLLTIDDFDYEGALREAKAYLNEAVAKRDELDASILLEAENPKYAEKQLDLAKRDYNRAADLAKRGTVTKKLADDREVIVSQRAQTVTSHEVNLKLQQARLEGQKAVIERLKWKVDQATRRLEETRLIAPFDGFITSVSAEIGRTVNVNDRIANLIDRERVDVRFILTDAQYGRILKSEGTLIGRKVEILWKVGESPIVFQGEIARIGAQITSETGGIEIYATIDTKDHPVPIRTGAFVEVKVNDREFKGVYRLPQTAIYEGNTIYVIENERLKPVKITPVGYAGSDTLVEAEIGKGAEILITRLTLAGEGVKVKPRKSSQKPDEKPVSAIKSSKGL